MRFHFLFVLLFQGVAIIQFAAVKRSKYDDYTFPLWADVVGWLFVGFEVALIPAVAIYKVMTMKTDLPLLDVSLSDETATLSNTQQRFTIMIITQPLRRRYTVRFARTEPANCPVHGPIVACDMSLEYPGHVKIR